MLRQTDQTFEKYFQIARAAEMARERIKTITAAVQNGYTGSS